ncbi:MAG: hypothetical protein WBE48_29380, partial [Xanthobacteraceae bacterium]
GEHRWKTEGESDAKNGGTPGQQRVNHDISISELGLQRIGAATNRVGGLATSADHPDARE